MLKFKHFFIVFLITLIASVIFAFVVSSGYVAEVLPQFMITRSMDGLANSSWPMDQHDKQHTNRANIKGAQTNNTKWTFYVGKWIATPPSIGADGTIYILGSKNASWNENKSDQNVSNINQSNLSSSSSNTGLNDSSSPSGYFLNAINPDGTLKWQTNYTFELLHDASAPLISKDGTIYIQGVHSIYALNQDGTLKWEYKVSDIPSPLNIGSDGTLYFTNKGRLYALNSDGSLKWETNKIDLDVSGSPTVGSDGTIYVFHQKLDNLALYAFNPDGSVKWNTSTGFMGETASPASIGPDGTIYFTTDAFGGGSGGYYLFALTQDGKVKWHFTSDSTLINGPEDYSNYFSPTIALMVKF